LSVIASKGEAIQEMNQYYVYILVSRRNGTLYVGVTHDLKYRVGQHKQKVVPGFTKKYQVTMLVYYESTGLIKSAIAREKQIKAGSRAKKIALIEKMNPEWRDLFNEL
jgi:putative endonuclease